MNIRLKLPQESFWAFQHPDLPKNQAEINNYVLNEDYSYGDRVEFNEDRKVTKLIKTREQVIEEQAQELGE